MPIEKNAVILMRLALLMTLTCAMLPTASAHPQVLLGDFRLGTPKQEVLADLAERFAEIEVVRAERYQVLREFYRASAPKPPCKSESARLSVVDVYFDAMDRLVQVDLVVETTDLNRVRALVPDGDKAKPEGSFGDMWEIIRDDGDIVFYVSELSGRSNISLAEKQQSAVNRLARQTSDAKFKHLIRRIDALIDHLQSSAAPKEQSQPQ